jgi:hypothetical protein
VGNAGADRQPRGRPCRPGPGCRRWFGFSPEHQASAEQIARVEGLSGADQGEAVFAPFRGLAEAYADMVRPMRYPALYAGPEQEVRFASGSNFFADSLDPGAPEAILE